MHDRATIAVLLTCHNRRQLTLKCLDSLFSQDIKETVVFKVYLVDDGSVDGTTEAVLEKYPEVNVINGDGSLFWNRGMYTAFAAAIEDGFDFYLWLNDDCELYNNTLNVLLESYYTLSNHHNSQAHIIGSAMQDSATGEFTYGGVRKYKTLFGRVKQNRIKPDDEQLLECQAVNGNCVLISGEVVKRIGNLDPVFTHRWGDHDYCFRALDHGGKVWLAPGYRGSCSANSIKGTWEDVSMSLGARFTALGSQRGYAPDDYKIYLKRHRGIWWGLNYIAPYIKILISQITGKLKPQ